MLKLEHNYHLLVRHQYQAKISVFQNKRKEDVVVDQKGTNVKMSSTNY